ncbi:ice-binding family protein [Adhaeribacter radiodurans]|uniref:DUF11 domain-containing protein n=1 Tax=Adhaeribacter radiodurans TaxID=2745197 RepID=A0A7L7LCU5_9BACT|nr:ice-binding family protein [Adhaeribacter radiodurans]QMU30199.1 DUF11 domain-containing protein [Adhaeribacter radiodurans]
MKNFLLIISFLLTTFRLCAQQAKVPDLKNAQDFAVLGPAGVSNADASVVFADLAVTTGTLTGFDPEIGPGVIIGTTELNTPMADAVLQSAKEAYDFVKNQTTEYTHGPKLGNGFTPVGDPEVTNGMILSPGVYSFSDPNVLLSGLLRLDGQNRTDAVFIFKIEGNFSYEPGSIIAMERGAQAKNVFFQINGVIIPASTGGIPDANAVLQGNYLVNNNGSATGEAIRLSEGTSVEGRILALNGSVTLQDNNIYLANIIEADLSIEKKSNRNTVPLGEMVTFTITVTNYGPQEAANVEVVEDFPYANLEVVDYSAPGSVQVIFEPDKKVFLFKLGSMKVKDKVVVTVTAKAIAPANVVTNKVAVKADTQDSNPIKNNAEVSIRIPTASANLYVTKTVNKTVAKVGDILNYVVTVENLGPDKATNVALTETFPIGFLSILGNPTVNTGNYTQNISVDPTSTYSQNLFTIGDLGVNEKAILTINARIIKNGRITNTAQITNNAVLDPTGLNNKATVVTDAGAVPLVDLQIIKKASSSTITLGNEVTYTLTARNNGPTNATGVVVTDVLASDLKYVRSSPEGQFDASTGTYSWIIGSLAAGQETSITLTALPQIAGQIANSAVIAGNELDLISGNDLSEVVICVAPSKPVLVAGKKEVCVGDIITFSVDNINGVTGFQYVLPVGFTKITGSNSTIVVKVDDTAKANSEISISPININSKCSNGESQIVQVKVNRPPALPGQITSPLAVCVGSEQTYTIAPVAGADNYTWTLPANWQIRSGQNTNTITVLVGADSGKISVLVSNSCGIGGSTETNSITPNAVPATPVITDKSGPCTGLMYTVTEVPGTTNYAWTVPEGFTITAGQGTTAIKVTADRLDRNGTITVIATNTAGCSSIAATFNADAKAADANLTFPTAFTPNGDDKNESWIVENLTKFPDNEIQILNRWGNEVFRARNYQNNWRATGLGEGTYFYVLRVKLCDGNTKLYRGYITVVR